MQDSAMMWECWSTVSSYVVHDLALLRGLSGVQVLGFIRTGKCWTANTRILASHERVGRGQINGQKRGDDGPSELWVKQEIKEGSRRSGRVRTHSNASVHQIGEEVISRIGVVLSRKYIRPSAPILAYLRL